MAQKVSSLNPVFCPLVEQPPEVSHNDLFPIIKKYLEISRTAPSLADKKIDYYYYAGLNWPFIPVIGPLIYIPFDFVYCIGAWIKAEINKDEESKIDLSLRFSMMPLAFT